MSFTSIRTITVAAVLLASCLSASAQHAAPKRTFKLPPSADLRYSVRAQQSGLALSGESTLKWLNGGDKYAIATETRSALVGKINEAKSDGTIDAFGLAPAAFTEKRWRKEATTTTFNRTSMAITFADAAAPTFPLLGGEQDRSSAIWQLIAIARANAAAFKPESVWELFVAGARDAEPWTFKVARAETLTTPLGVQRTIHITRAPPPDSKGQQLDIWLAPELEWYPVRLRFTDADGDFIEQTLEKIGKADGA
jgi:hypothetical protein